MNPSLPALIARLHAFSGIAHKRDIQQVARELRDAWPNPSPNGDDCALIPDGSGYKLLAIEGFINRFVAEDPWFAGWCGVMVNLSDIAAMGGRPLAVVNALWDEAQPHAAQILQGMAAASRAYQVPIVGGHTNLRSDRSQLAVAVLGETASPLSSSAAQAGQTLMVAINLQGRWHPPGNNWDAATRADPAELRRALALLPELAAEGSLCAAKDISQAGLAGTLTTVLCEVNSPGEYWWQMVETLGITRMLTIAGAIRMARRQGKPRADLTSLRTLYLAGEPLDNATDEWVAAQLGVPCENHYWQTESGWPLLAGSGRALSPVFTRAAEVVHPASGKTCAPGETGMLVINNTLGPGGMSTLWQNDIQHDQYYWSYRQRQWRYATHDCAIRVGERIIIQGRMDDVMNIGGKRIATAEIENALMGLEGVVEVVAAGTAHYLLGEMVALFVVTDIADPAQQAALKKNICARLVARCGRFAVPRRIHITSALPKTFSGKVMRRILA